MDVSRRLIYATTIVVAAAWVVLDQATKMLAVRTYSVQAPDDLGPVILRLIYNEGGAFSLPLELPWVFVVVTIIVCILVARALPDTTSALLAGAFGLVVGGAIGNAADRIFRDGAVVDMIDLDFPPLQNFPVFNVADIGITVGAVLVGLLMYLADRAEQSERIPVLHDGHTVEGTLPDGSASEEIAQETGESGTADEPSVSANAEDP